MGWKGQVVESCSGAEASLLPLAEGLLRSPPHPQAGHTLYLSFSRPLRITQPPPPILAASPAF